MFKLGQMIVWTGDLSGSCGLNFGRITQIKKFGPQTLYWVDNKHKGEDVIYAEYIYPAKYGQELAKILATRRKLLKEYKDSMALVYQLRNKMIREQAA